MMTREEFETALTVFQRMAVADHTWREAAIPMEDAAPFYYDKILAAYDAQAQTIKALEAGLREITELRPVDALGSAVERAQAIAHIALKEAGL